MAADSDDANAGANEAEVTDLVDRAMQALFAGGEPAMAAFCDGLARHRDVVMHRLSALRRLGLLGETTAPLPQTPEFPERLGDFELIEPLGRGGMGIVCRARQRTLDREVAIKLIRPEQLHFPGVRERFRREVEIIARLQHEGIVQLYSFGEDRGIPWFAMELIRGVSLAHVIERLAKSGGRPSGADVRACLLESASQPEPATLFEGEWVDIALRIVERAAVALDQAHQQGVLHRDIKPSNIMLTAAGRVVLLDFGLAWTPAADRLTRSGAELGTIHYMAPEQFRGADARVDERSDVYSLGVVLRELVTLRAVFTGSTIDEVASQVRQGICAPFGGSRSSLRRDVETICLVAMDRDPQRRYPSARLFARDLRCVLERRPIEATRPGLGVRLRRFAQRNRALTTGGVVAATALLSTPLVVAAHEHGLRVEIEQSNRELLAQVARADGNLRCATDAVNEILQKLEDEQVSAVPDLAPFVDTLLAQCSVFLDNLSRTNPEDPEARLYLARVLARAANVQWTFFDLERTEALFQRALALVQTSVGNRDQQDELELEVRMSLVWVSRMRGNEAVAAYEQALARAGRAGAIEGRSLQMRRLAARCMERCGNLQDRAGQARGREWIETAARLRDQILAEAPSVLSWVEVATIGRELAAECDLRKDTSGAERHRARVDAALDAAETCSGGIAIEDRDRLITVLIQRAAELGTEEGALSCLQRAERHCLQMIQQRPTRLSWLDRWYNVVGRIVSWHDRRGFHADALSRKLSSLDRIRTTLRVWPDNAGLLRHAVADIREIARLARRTAAPGLDMDALFDEGIGFARRIETASARRAAFFDQAQRLFADRCRRRLDGDQPAAALADAEDAVRMLDLALTLAPADKIVVTDDPTPYLLQIESLLRLGRIDEAAAVATQRLPSWPADALELAPTLRDHEADPRFARIAQLRRGQ